MKWKEKSCQIADEIIRKIGQGAPKTYTREEVLEALRQAAMKGMMWECENWVLKRK